MRFKTYTLNHPITNEIRYIGYTSTSLKERLRGHLKDIHKEKYKNSHRAKWIAKLERDSLIPTINLLNEYDTKEEAVFNEIKLIFEYRLLGYNLVNGTDGGEGGAGYKFTKEQIDAKIKRQTGKKIKPCSEERKLKISQSNKGRKLTEEQRIKMVGMVKSEEHRKKLSEANKGYKVTENAKKLMSEARKIEWANGKRKATRKGMKNSESHKEKMRGSNNPFFGKKHSPETMLKIKETYRKKKELKLLQQSIDNI